MPQVPEATYKSEGTFNNALYFLVKNGWLQEDETALLSSMNPEYEALIVNVPQLMNVDFTELFYLVWITPRNKQSLAVKHGSWTRWRFITMATLASSCAHWGVK